MKKSSIVLFILVIVITIIFCFTACASKANNQSANDMAKPQSPEKMELAVEEQPNSSSINLTATQRKIIKNLEFHLETKDYDKTIADLEGFISETKGYIESSSASGSVEEKNINSRFVVKIPSESVDSFKEMVKKIGNITYTAEGGQDITGEYYDTDARLKMLKIQEERLLELMKKAENVTDLLSIENELTRIRTEIERLTTVMKNYDNLVDFATVTLNITLTNDYTIKTNSFLDEIATSFKNSIQFIKVLLEKSVLALVWLSPFIVIALIITAVILINVKKNKNKKNTVKVKNETEK